MGFILGMQERVGCGFVPGLKAQLLAGLRILAVEDFPPAKKSETALYVDGPNRKASQANRRIWCRRRVEIHSRPSLPLIAIARMHL